MILTSRIEVLDELRSDIPVQRIQVRAQSALALLLYKTNEHYSLAKDQVVAQSAIELKETKGNTYQDPISNSFSSF